MVAIATQPHHASTSRGRTRHTIRSVYLLTFQVTPTPTTSNPPIMLIHLVAFVSYFFVDFERPLSTFCSSPMTSSTPTKDLHQAYRDFMLQGRGTAVAINPGSHTPTNNNNNNSTSSSSTSSQLSTPRRHQKHVYDSYYKTIRQDWWEIDDVLTQVVASVAELRRRWYVIAQKTAAQRERQQQQHDSSTTTDHHNNDNHNAMNLKARDGHTALDNHHHHHHHHHHHQHLYLTDEDMDLASCHCVRKHEKALQNLRSLLAQLGQAQETLGRRLEHVLTETTATTTDITTTNGTMIMENHRCAVRLYQTAAMDLYNKQMWGYELLSSWHPSLPGDDEMQTQIKSADKIATRWSRLHPQSPWQQISSLVEQLC